MSRFTAPHTARRLSAITVLALAASVALAAPASAHVEVEAKDASALAENVTLDFTAETESDKAGITKLEVILPEGIAPADVTYKEGPTGWKLEATDRGYTVGGPQVAVGKDAAYAVTVRQLPDAKSLAFKTLQTYSDGRVDRWIELEEPAEGEHGSPAPMLELKPAAPGAKPASPSPAAEPSTTEPSSPAASEPADKQSVTPTEAATAGKEDDGSNPVLITALVVVVLALIGGGLWWFRRRGDANTA
ncbi:DUF1775 domain-containing protein [Streptomyces sp. NPDC057539]|uniref:DUF1775 domain-containing protein n=1 Tax=Streptomyces sp. NPDC057539 TaxID=3346159 RepID=UPI003687F5C4